MTCHLKRADEIRLKRADEIRHGRIARSHYAPPPSARQANLAQAALKALRQFNFGASDRRLCLPSSLPRGMLIDVSQSSAEIVKISTPCKRRLQFRLRSLLLLVTAACLALGWFGWRLELLRREYIADTLRPIICDEVASLQNHPWAGEYYSGDGLGVNISLAVAPKSGYLYEWRGCGGLYDRNYGPVACTNDRLQLTSRLPKRESSGGIADELIPVRWGSRQYLIAPDEIVGFCNAVNDGTEPRDDIHGLHLLRRGDEAKTATGFPTVPDEFKDYLLARPIEAEIIKVEAWTDEKTIIMLNRGKTHGLRPGMELHVFDPDEQVDSATLTKVENDRSGAMMAQLLGDEPAPRIGWKLSTRSSWYTSPE